MEMSKLNFHSPEKYLTFKVVYYGWTTTATNFYLESTNNSVYLEKLIKFIE